MKHRFDLLPVPNGYKMKVFHVHDKERLQDVKIMKKPPKYFTMAVLLDDEGYPVSAGTAACSPRDNPSRKLGRAIAWNRCVSYFYGD